MHFGYPGANVCMTDLPFLAAQASDEVGDRFTDFVGHIFLHVETRVDRHLGLVFERAGKVAGGTRKAVASGDVDEQLRGTGFLQLVRIDLHQGCVLRRLTIERDIVGHDNAGQAGLTGPADRLGIDGFLDLAEVAENATFEQHHSGEEIVPGGGLGAFAFGKCLKFSTQSAGMSVQFRGHTMASI